MNKTFLISTPIYYVNEPRVHLGHALSTLTADILARWRRLNGDRVHFSTGTDEHGIKVAKAAKAAGLSPQKFVDQNATNFRASWDKLNISYDDFVRTTEERHKKNAQKFLQALRKRGFVYKDIYEGLYCEGCEAFVKEDELAKGGLCPLHNTKPQKYKEENWFFKLSQFAGELQEAIEKDEIKILPQGKKAETLAIIKSGLEDISISRQSLKWGIPLPWDAGQVTYVWVEALVNYLTTAGYGQDGKKFSQLWPTDWNILGKDILRFHTIIWPALLWAAGLPAPKAFFIHSFLTFEGQKMSKTLGNIVYPEDLISQFGTDATRYLIASELPRNHDTNLNQKDLELKYAGSLKNGLGNLFSRIIVLAQRIHINETEPTNSKISQEAEKITKKAWKETEDAYKTADIKKALEKTWQLVHWTDQKIDEFKPWRLIADAGDAKKNEQNIKKVREIIFAGLEILRQIGLLTAPVIPETALKLHQALSPDKPKLDTKRTLKSGELEKLREFGKVKLTIPREKIHLFK
jgi:methionyl-tRNA synthetase